MMLQAANKNHVHKTHVFYNTQMNDWQMLNFNLQDRKMNEKCINKLANVLQIHTGQPVCC